MPQYKVTDSETGRTLVLTGDSPPSDDELAELFKTSPTGDSVKGGEPWQTDITAETGPQPIPPPSPLFGVSDAQYDAQGHTFWGDQWDAMRRSKAGHVAFGPTEMEHQGIESGGLAGLPGGDPGVVPIALSSPEFPLIPGPLQKVMLPAFVGHTAIQAPDIYKEAAEAAKLGDWRRFRQAAIPFALQGAMLGLGAGHAIHEKYLNSPEYARDYTKAAEIHGDVPPQPGEGEQTVPTEEGGAGVQPPSAGPQGVQPQGKTSEIPLKPKVGLTEEQEAAVKKDWQFATAAERLEMADGSNELAQKNWWALTPDEKNAIATRTGMKLGEVKPKEPEAPPAETIDDINSRILQLSKKQEHFMFLEEGEQAELAELRKKRDAAEADLFSEEDRKVINAEREALDVPIDVKPGVQELKEDEPFAPNKRRPGVFMQPNRQTRRIEIFPEAFNEWAEGIDPSVRDAAIRARINEERIHLDVSNDAAKAYWNSLSGWEKKLAEKFYLGERGGKGYNETLLGHEAFRTRIQQLRGLSPSEIAERAGLEKWTLKGIEIIQTSIRALRELYIRKFGSPEQRAILNGHLEALERVQRGINIARGIITGEPPAAMSKSAWKRIQEHQQKVKEELEKEARGEMPEEEITARIAQLNRQGEVSYLTDAERNELANLRVERDKRTRWEEPGALNRRRTKAEFEAQKKRDLEKLMQLKAAKELGVEVPKIPWSEAAPGMAEQPPVPESERVGTGHDYRGVTPGGVNWMVAKNLVSDKVGFDHFLSSAKAEFGPKVESGALFDLYVDRAVKLLGGARASKIEDLLSKLRLWGAVLGSRRASYNVKGLIPEPPGTARAELTRVERQIANYRRKAEDLDNLAQEHDMKIQEEPKYEKTQTEMFQESRSAAEGSVERHHAVRAKNLRARATKLRQEADLLENGATPKPVPTAAPESHEGRLFRFKTTPEAAENRYEYIAQNKPFIEVPRSITGKSDAPLPAGETPKTYGDKLRARAIAAIIQKLVGSTGRPSLSRTDIVPDDLRWTEGNKAFREVPEDLHDDPVLLGHMLTEGGGERRDVKFVEAGGQKVRSTARNPETVTKRLVLMVDPRTGTAYLVDAYRSARHGVMIGDPASRAGLHSPVETMLKRYRPVYSMLLDHPVKNFFKRFESLESFNDKFGNEARERAEQSEAEAQAPESVSAIEGTPGIHPKEKRGIFERRFRLTPREAQVVYESFDAVENPQGAREMLDSLISRAERHGEFTKTRGADLMAARERLNHLRRERSGMGQEKMDLLREYGREGETVNVEGGQLEFKKRARRRALDTRIEKAQEAVFKLEELQKQGMTPRHWLLLNAIRKVGNRIFQEYPRQKFEEWKAFSKANPEVRMPFNEYADTSERALLAETLNQLYDASRQNPTKTNFVTEAARRSFAESQAGAEPAARPSEFSRELELPHRGSRPALREPIRGYRTTPESVRGEDVVGNARERMSVASKTAKQRALEIARRIQQEPREPSPSQEADIRGFKMAQEGIREGERELAQEAQEEFDVGESRYERSAKEYAAQDAYDRVQEAFDQAEPGAVIRRPRNKKSFVREKLEKAILNPALAYGEWMVERIGRLGGPQAKMAAEGFAHIIDRAKQVYGGMTPKLDAAKRAAGVFGAKAFGLNIGNKGIAWLRSIRTIPGASFAGTSRMADAMDALANQNRGRTGARMAARRVLRTIPAEAQDVANKLWESNYEAGQILQPVTPGFIPSGAFEKNMTALGMDTLRDPFSEIRRKWIIGTARANGWTGSARLGTRHRALSPMEVEKMFEDLKKAIDEPAIDSAHVERIKQDFSMKLPNVVTHIKHGGQWHELIHSSPFNYIENVAQRAAHIRAFREQFPNTPQGRAVFKDMMTRVNAELPSGGQEDLQGLIRTLQGHPTDSFSNYGAFGPTRTIGAALRSFNATVGNVMAKMVLTGQMATQLGEMAVGATPQFLGPVNYARGLLRLKQLQNELELAGARNRVIYDWSYDPTAPIRSASRIAGNVLSKAFAENFLNEMQEMAAAATARVVSERIETGQLTDWEKRMLPETFRQMGFSESNVRDMMNADQQLLGQFQRRAAAFLTSGNKALAEGSRLGSKRLFNSIFRFQTYPMMKANQLAKVTGRFSEEWFTKNGTWQGKMNTAEQLAKFVAGNTLQGALTVGIVTLAMRGLFGAEVKKNEAKDAWGSFLMESFLSSMSGPLYMLWRGARYKGALGVGEQATRAIFPYAIGRELMDMAQGQGQYKDKDLIPKIGQFLKNKTPGLQMIGTGLSIFGIGSESRDLDTAMKAFWNWRRERLGYSNEDTHLTDEEDVNKKFRKNMKDVAKAIQSGDEDAFNEAMEAAMEAVPEEKEPQKAWRESLARRHILRSPTGKPLSDDLQEALVNRIGQKAYDLLEDYDSMIDAAMDFSFEGR